MKRLILISSLFFFIFSENIIAQSNYKSPKKAAMLSLAPGLGQAYTKKYWKIPIIYSALLASGYYINDNNSKYVLYRDTYLNRMNGINDDLNYTDSQLITLKDLIFHLSVYLVMQKAYLIKTQPLVLFTKNQKKPVP